MPKYAVITFDEPEFEPSYVNSNNRGMELFSILFFFGKCRFSNINLKIFKNKNKRKNIVYFIFQIIFCIKCQFKKIENVFDFLDKNSIKATFFGIFELLEKRYESRPFYKKAFEQIYKNGHELGLHGYRHSSLTKEHISRSIFLSKTILNIDLKSYSSPWGLDLPETEELLYNFGFIGWRTFCEIKNNKPCKEIIKIPYVTTLKGTKNLKAKEKIVLNYHSYNFYPFTKKRIQKEILQLKNEGFIFVTFKELCFLSKTKIK